MQLLFTDGALLGKHERYAACSLADVRINYDFLLVHGLHRNHTYFFSELESAIPYKIFFMFFSRLKPAQWYASSRVPLVMSITTRPACVLAVLPELSICICSFWLRPLPDFLAWPMNWTGATPSTLFSSEHIFSIVSLYWANTIILQNLSFATSRLTISLSFASLGCSWPSSTSSERSRIAFLTPSSRSSRSTARVSCNSMRSRYFFRE